MDAIVSLVVTAGHPLCCLQVVLVSLGTHLHIKHCIRHCNVSYWSSYNDIVVNIPTDASQLWLVGVVDQQGGLHRWAYFGAKGWAGGMNPG